MGLAAGMGVECRMGLAAGVGVARRMGMAPRMGLACRGRARRWCLRLLRFSVELGRRPVLGMEWLSRGEYLLSALWILVTEVGWIAKLPVSFAKRRDCGAAKRCTKYCARRFGRAGTSMSVCSYLDERRPPFLSRLPFLRRAFEI